MANARRYLLLSVLLGLASAAAWADSVDANTALFLTSFQISSPSGAPLITPTPSASTYAEALDSNGGYSSQSGSASAVASDGTLANASGAASGSGLTGSAIANVALPLSFNGFAYAEGDSVLSGTFEIIGPTGPVSVTLTADLSSDQFLQTTESGVSAYSYSIFTLSLPDVSPNPVLSFSNLPSIGPDDTLTANLTPTETTSIPLMANTPYSFVLSLDAESNGVSVTPEPPSGALLLTALGLWPVLRSRFARKSRPAARS